MANIKHSSIADYERLIEDNKALYIVQEVGGHVSLSEFVRQGRGKKLDENEARELFNQLISAVGYLHELGICHRDLKLTNILINDEGN
jgi:serine/threonine protein kinase